MEEKKSKKKKWPYVLGILAIIAAACTYYVINANYFKGMEKYEQGNYYEAYELLKKDLDKVYPHALENIGDELLRMGLRSSCPSVLIDAREDEAYEIDDDEFFSKGDSVYYKNALNCYQNMAKKIVFKREQLFKCGLASIGTGLPSPELEELAELGDDVALCLVGDQYAKSNPEKALSYYEKAMEVSKSGLPAFKMCFCYLYGLGVDKDPVKAKKYLEQSFANSDLGTPIKNYVSGKRNPQDMTPLLLDFMQKRCVSEFYLGGCSKNFSWHLSY